MNIVVVGDRSFSVDILIEFYDVKKLWRFMATIDTVKVMSTSGNAIAKVVFTVVGRRPEELMRITLEYDGHRVVLEPGETEFRDLNPIVIYDGGRDYWDIQLRRMALRA